MLHPIPYTLHPAPYTMNPAPYTLHPTLYTIHPTPYTLHTSHYTLHTAPYTLQYTPYTLHPTPYTLHPTPYTLHPAPYTGQKGAQHPNIRYMIGRNPLCSYGIAYRRACGASRGRPVCTWKHDLSTEQFPMSAYVGGSKNLKDLKDLPSPARESPF